MIINSQIKWHIFAFSLFHLNVSENVETHYKFTTSQFGCGRKPLIYLTKEMDLTLLETLEEVNRGSSIIIALGASSSHLKYSFKEGQGWNFPFD